MKSEHTNTVREVKVTLKERVAPKLVINAVHNMDTKNAQHLGRSVINVVLRTILARVADPRRLQVKLKAVRIVENPPKAGVLRDVTDPVEADAPIQDHDPEVDHRPRDTHNIEINRYNDDCLLKTFNTIYRSRLVTTISNDTDPDGRTKILTQLKIKLPHCKRSLTIYRSRLTVVLKQIFYCFILSDWYSYMP